MAFRALIRQPLTHRPTLRISPSVLRSSYSAAAAKSTEPVAKTEPAATKTEQSKEESVVKSEESIAKTEENKELADEKKVKKEEPEHGYAYGAHHWNMERGSAIALIPLVSTQFIYGAHPIVDGLLGVVLPYHLYMGFDSCITDYIPKRVYPRLHKLSNWTLTGATGLVMWGCYEFNTNDIGITEFFQRLFAA